MITRTSTGIDVQDARVNTCAPFVYGSQLRLGNTRLSPGGFVSVRIYCSPDTVLPVRLSEVSRNSSGMYCVKFSDSAGSLVGSWTFTRDSAMMAFSRGSSHGTGPIVSPEGILRGHMAYSEELAVQLMGAALGGTGTTKADDGDFVLLPECHVAYPAGGCRSISVNGVSSASGLVLVPYKCVHTREADGTWRIGLATNTQDAREDKVCVLSVDNCTSVNGESHDPNTSVNLWVAGKHLVIRSGITSNLRVTGDGRSIRFKGVSDG